MKEIRSAFAQNDFLMAHWTFGVSGHGGSLVVTGKQLPDQQCWEHLCEKFGCEVLRR